MNQLISNHSYKVTLVSGVDPKLQSKHSYNMEVVNIMMHNGEPLYLMSFTIEGDMKTYPKSFSYHHSDIERFISNHTWYFNVVFDNILPNELFTL